MTSPCFAGRCLFERRQNGFFALNKLSQLCHSVTSLAHELSLEHYRPCFIRESSTVSLLHSITTLASLGRLSEAFSAFSLLCCSFPSTELLAHLTTLLLRSASNFCCLLAGEQLHAFSITVGLLPHPDFLPRLTTFYLSCGLFSAAASVSKESVCVLPWNILISSYVRDGFYTEALAAYMHMSARGVVPDHFTYPSILKACGEVGNLDVGREIHRSILNSGIRPNVFVDNALVAMYVKCGEFEIARNMFDEMPERDVVSWNSIISGYASRGLWEEAFQLFERAKEENTQVNSVTWNTIIGGLLQKGDHLKALRLLSQMKRSKILDFVTVIIGLNACSRIGALRVGMEIHGLAVRMLCDSQESVRNALITMYSRCKRIGIANLLFEMDKNSSLVTWNAMLAGFALDDRAEEASVLFRGIMLAGLPPNYVTVVTILSLCARVANLQHGRELHCYIAKQEFTGYRLLYNSLIDTYSKSGRISVARRVFNSMTDRDVVSYTSLIAGYGMQGEGDASVQLFEEMLNRGIKPDHVSMVAILSACSHSGLVSKGEELFNQMEGTFRIKPRMEHLSCMVDLYSRAGLLEKAETVINKHTLQPTPAMWAALVGACQVYRNTEIGERAAKRLLEMKTDNAGHYVLIANMYAAAECWGDLAKVRTMMRDVGVRKAPGCAWADLGKGFEPFLVGDQSSTLSPGIYGILESLTEQMSNFACAFSEELSYEE
ncbi:hypothetical protein HPP92_004306 [Vanilla planifolia]|uniref:Pentatricopeptide repeat-containing protein n=1 Tax=Vanilla planifolia TaxID=51239 RepID=A0A835VJR9_VANPL|nr:hypothetical protein HPP92_004306 [Vanilla planifolia]